MTVGKHIGRIELLLFEWKSNVLLLDDMCEISNVSIVYCHIL